MTSHGGSRPGAGRTYAYREPLRRVTRVPACGRLPESSIEQLRRYGENNPSEGIRRLVEEAHTQTGQFWYRMPDWATNPKASNHQPIDTPAHS